MTEGRLAPEEVRTRTFTRVVRGYRRREVRRLLQRAADDLARLRDGPTADGPHDQPPLTPEQVEEARFQPALGGYEMDEVDTFLDQVVAELERAAHEPLRPPSALPAPPRQEPFPAAHAPAAQSPAAQAPAAPAVDNQERPTAESATLPPRGAEPGAGPRQAAPTPAASPEPPAASHQPLAATPGPAFTPPEPPAVTSGPPFAPPEPPAAAPRPPVPAPGPPARPEPAPPPAAADEGFFPPSSAPPSAAPPPPPPPPPPAPRPPVATPARPLSPSEVETQTFERGAPGYLPAHVDLFLAKAARALAGRDGETLTRWDVLRQRFPLGPRGYATSEVDAFVVRLAAQFPDPDPAAQQEILRKLQGG
jgi:DivIVA domain-containing protein